MCRPLPSRAQQGSASGRLGGLRFLGGEQLPKTADTKAQTTKVPHNYRSSWRLLYKIRTRPRGPTKSFKSHRLTSKERVHGVRLAPPLVTILIENDNSAWNKKREEIF